MLPSPSAGIPTPSTAAGTKRPAASDLHRSAGAQATPTKRHATKASAIAGPAGVVGAGGGAPVAVMPASLSSVGSPLQMPPMPMLVTEDQLSGRSPEQLIATILQIQAQHQQYIANISAQYESITQQLNELKGSLAAFYSGQAGTAQSAASQLQAMPQGYSDSRLSRPVAAAPPIIPQQAAPGPPRPSTSHPANRPARPLPPSPQTIHTDARLMPKQPGIQTPQTPGPPAYDYRTVGTVEEVWKEYREGMDGQPAIEDLDATWGSRWRPEPRGRTWYSRRKVIWDKIKEYVAEGMDEDHAVRQVEKLRDGGTINKLIRLLQDERKDKGLGDDSIAA
ncbi:transcriptional activator of glycolytic enzymes-domain-containing protein [Xylariales sp. AK1849]|nr:transcriptional activator of glycolytic enzymes-domain-containing protein [Xylariales sp. AK1849]